VAQLFSLGVIVTRLYFMPKKTTPTLKEVVQDGLPILADIVDIRVSKFPNDAGMFLQIGAVLLSVGKFEESGHPPQFHFVLGWPKTAGDRPELWIRYGVY